MRKSAEKSSMALPLYDVASSRLKEHYGLPRVLVPSVVLRVMRSCWRKNINCSLYVGLCGVNEDCSTDCVSQYNLIPKAEMSLKVLAELPIIVVLMYQLYKQHVHNDVAEFIPLIMNTIVLQPTPQQRCSSCLLSSLFLIFFARRSFATWLTYFTHLLKSVCFKKVGAQIRPNLTSEWS